MAKFRNTIELVEFVRNGGEVRYLFFWGHRDSKCGVSKSCLSQWYESPFFHEGQKYKTAEHFMMAGKATLFGDSNSAAEAIAAKSPSEAKKIGRKIIGFDENIWEERRFSIVVEANLNKFDQNPELKQFLFSTGERVLVEASPVDRIWGIGMAADNNNIENPSSWNGLNMLGFALMEVREILSP